MPLDRIVRIGLLLALVGCASGEQPATAPGPSTGTEEGMLAPDFTLASNEEGDVTLSAFRGTHNVVLYFYPKDGTPGCTFEACSFRDLRAQFNGASTKILGVSADGLGSHADFAKVQTLNFTLLADPEFTVSKLYGVEQVIAHQGRTFHFARRATFVIDKRGVIRKVYPNVDASLAKHAADVLAFVKTLNEN